MRFHRFADLIRFVLVWTRVIFWRFLFRYFFTRVRAGQGWLCDAALEGRRQVERFRAELRETGRALTTCCS